MLNEAKINFFTLNILMKFLEGSFTTKSIILRSKNNLFNYININYFKIK